MNNIISEIKVSNNIVLNEIICEGNNLSACALDELFHSLPDRISEYHSGEIYIKRSNSLASNPGTYGCNTTIANAKKSFSLAKSALSFRRSLYTPPCITASRACFPGTITQ